MSLPKKKKILVALDGSERMYNAVHYIRRQHSFTGLKVVLFHVLNSAPPCFYDLEREPKPVKTVTYFRAWENQQKKRIEADMEKASMILKEGGLPNSSVKVKIHKKQTGIARDILKEASNDYDAIVLGRKSSGLIPGLALGSVASKLLERLTDKPVMVVGRDIVGNDVLIAVDGSENSSRAVRFVANTLNGDKQNRIGLLHVVRKDSSLTNMPDREEIQNHLHMAVSGLIEPFFEKSRKQLVESGCPAENISQKVVTGVSSRAKAIVEEATSNGYGTIVLGRRGHSHVKDFFMGRVSNKVVQLGRTSAVWMVT